MKKIVLFSIAGLLTIGAFAQGKKTNFPNGDAKRWMFGLQGGPSFFHGDANEPGIGYAAGIAAQYSFSHMVGFRVLGNYGQLKGTDSRPSEGPYDRFEFTNNFWEAQGQVVVTIGNVSYLRKARKMNFYLAAGMGAMGNGGTSKYATKELPNVELEGKYDDVIYAFSGSTGFRYSLSPAIALGLEYNLRFASSDEVDLLNYAAFGNKSRDLYSFGQATITFKLGQKGKEHVEWINPVDAIYENIAQIEKRVDALSSDQDGDGISDHFDKDNTTPPGAMVYGNGQAIDSDGDGIADALDAEPFSPAGAVVDGSGKAEDSDGDGVPDVLDLSPNTDPSLLVNHQGIPIMTKELASKLSDKGGSGGLGVGFMPAILFETGSARVNPIHYNDLQGIAEVIKRSPGLTLMIIGNADVTGNAKLNEKLALQRAEAVKKVLVENFGVNANRLKVQSNGDKVPIAKGKDPLSLQANRRVQFFISE